ncbi:aromatic amino acid transaminase [Gilvimarinus chinensis]|uniref:amino acid aminotransferase n=1 Tax=Gilvimarinus chinensis TaxID=396005 RepID=UPI00036DFCCD|nr:amino acid aminotransferase [Gilvimarinus chinensis]
MFDQLSLLQPDPILGLSAAFRSDTNSNKVDLGVGVYKTEVGETPVLDCVTAAEKQLLQHQTTKSYTPPAGIEGANRAAAELAFGTEHSVIEEQRLSTVQTPGGCGALRLAAELIAKANPQSTIWVSAPTWANHVPLLTSAGLRLKEYPYYDFAKHKIDFNAMVNTLKAAGPNDLVLLHACCHNPSGADLSNDQWRQLSELASERGFTPFIDMAYQGFGSGIAEDAYGVRLLAETQPELVLAMSFSKNLGLYRERAGSLSIVSANKSQAGAVQSQTLSIARGLYSMPPSHGASIVDTVYHSEELRSLWFSELTDMRERIAGLRLELVKALNERQDKRDFGFIAQEAGMFSFLGLSVEQVNTLKNQFSVYMTDNSRINVAGINQQNLPYLADAIVQVL